jgi:hypothetical protein
MELWEAAGYGEYEVIERLTQGEEGRKRINTEVDYVSNNLSLHPFSPTVTIKHIFCNDTECNGSV